MKQAHQKGLKGYQVKLLKALLKALLMPSCSVVPVIISDTLPAGNGKTPGMFGAYNYPAGSGVLNLGKAAEKWRREGQEWPLDCIYQRQQSHHELD